jgi:hypothetical protein
MKIYTITTCGQCPMYDPDRKDYTDYGECLRLSRKRVFEFRLPPEECPLKEWRE